ncbi:MAG: YhcH/YjgK/YiaL family protein [Verrucomicrobiales bacterium]|nr:YhcH/YjgK/YiaL family protein [Verrucomicrobiales bacterium]
MIYGHLSAPDAWAHLLKQEAWRFAFDWLRALPADPEPGIRPLRGDDIYVNVHGYDTLPREQCRFESHRKYVDLQYCIRGAELIDWKLSMTLQPSGPFDEPKDLQFYWLAPSLSVVHMVPGSFAIFFPTDAHLPKRSDGLERSVFKLVIKVAQHLVNPSV